MKAALREKIVETMSGATELAIATNREDGYPQNTTVSYVNDGLTLYFICQADSQKARNLGRDDRLSITLTTPYASWHEIKGLSMSGRARFVSEPETIEHVERMFLERFPEAAPLEEVERGELAIYEVVPEVVSVLDYTLGFGHTDFAIVSEGDIAETKVPEAHIWLPARA